VRRAASDAALRAGRPAEARTAFDAALQTDAELVPPGVRSFHAVEMRRRLADALVEAGRSAFERQQHAEAFQQWSTALSYQPAQASALDGLARLERLASSWIAGEPDCEAVRKTLRVTVATPPSAAHAKASAALAGRCSG
jgi:tetratricopeptide (TPR) repeat protein